MTNISIQNPHRKKYDEKTQHRWRTPKQRLRPLYYATFTLTTATIV